MGFDINETKLAIFGQSVPSRSVEINLKHRPKIPDGAKDDASNRLEDNAVELDSCQNVLQGIEADNRDEIKQKTKANPIMTLLNRLISTILSNER